MTDRAKLSLSSEHRRRRPPVALVLGLTVALVGLGVAAVYRVPLWDVVGLLLVGLLGVVVGWAARGLGIVQEVNTLVRAARRLGTGDTTVRAGARSSEGALGP